MLGCFKIGDSLLVINVANVSYSSSLSIDNLRFLLDLLFCIVFLKMNRHDHVTKRFSKETSLLHSYPNLAYPDGDDTGPASLSSHNVWVLHCMAHQKVSVNTEMFLTDSSLIQASFQFSPQQSIRVPEIVFMMVLSHFSFEYFIIFYTCDLVLTP